MRAVSNSTFRSVGDAISSFLTGTAQAVSLRKTKTIKKVIRAYGGYLGITGDEGRSKLR